MYYTPPPTPSNSIPSPFPYPPFLYITKRCGHLRAPLKELTVSKLMHMFRLLMFTYQGIWTILDSLRNLYYSREMIQDTHQCLEKINCKL